MTRIDYTEHILTLGIGRLRQLPNLGACSLEESRVAFACCPDHMAHKLLHAILLLLFAGSFKHTIAHSQPR